MTGLLPRLAGLARLLPALHGLHRLLRSLRERLRCFLRGLRLLASALSLRSLRRGLHGLRQRFTSPGKLILTRRLPGRLLRLLGKLLSRLGQGLGRILEILR